MANQYSNIPVPTPTQNAVPSADIRDHVFGGAKIDEFVTSLLNTYIDRLGGEHYTVEGLKNLLKKMVSDLGLVPFGTFEAGATLTNGSQAMKYEGDGNYYRWDGDFDKVVPAGSTPESTGGVAKGAWINVTDMTLRSNLVSSEEGMGSYLVSYNRDSFYSGNVHEYFDKSIKYVTPEMFGILPGDPSSSYGEKLNLLFNTGYVVYIPPGEYYCDTEIVVNNKKVNVDGAGEGLSSIIFTGVTQGIKIIQDSEDYYYNLSGFSIKTNSTPNSGYSGLTIDGKGQLSGVSTDSSGMKALPNRTKQRGTLSNICCSGINGSTAWAKCFDFISQMRQRCNSLTATGLDDFTSGAGIGIDLRGDGYCVDSSFTDLMFTNLATGFRMPDYFEGVTIDTFKFVNVIRGILQRPIDGVTVIPTNQARILDPKITNGHINAVYECISCTLINTGTLTNLLLYRNPINATTYAHVSIVAMSGVKIYGISLRQIGDYASVNNFGFVLNSGYNNTLTDIDAIGNRSVARIGGNANSFYSNSLNNLINRGGTFVLEVVAYANSNVISDVKNYGGIGPAVLSESGTVNFINYNAFYYGGSFTIDGASEEVLSIDITNLDMNDTPVSVRISDQVTSDYSTIPLIYIYDKPASTKKLVVLRVVSSTGNPVSTIRQYVAEIRGF